MHDAVYLKGLCRVYEEQKAFLLRENAEHERAINELLAKAGSVSAENAQLKQASSAINSAISNHVMT